MVGRRLYRRTKNLYLHLIRIHHILPPVVANPIFASCCFGQMSKPPLVVFANIPIAPISGCYGADLSFEIRKVFQPVIGFARNGSWIVPIVIALAVRREMDISQRSLAWRGFLVTDEPPP